MPTSADFDAVVALGGGKPYATLTVEQYNAQQTEAESAEQAQELFAEWNMHLNETINPAIATGSRSSLIAAITQALAEISD
jgi:hypothetical protein